MHGIEKQLRTLYWRGFRISKFRPGCFVIGLNCRFVLSESELQSDKRVHMAVWNVVNDLAHRPSALTIRRVQLRLVQAFYSRAHFRRRGCNLLDRFPPPFGRHLCGQCKFSNGITRVHLILSSCKLDLPIENCFEYSCGVSPRSTRIKKNASPIWTLGNPVRERGDATIPSSEL